MNTLDKLNNTLLNKDVENLDVLNEMVIELKNTCSLNNKKDILDKYLKKENNEYLLKLLKYVYDPNIKFNLKSKKSNDYLKENEVDLDNFDLNLFSILDKLSTREISGNSACVIWNKFKSYLPSNLNLLVDSILDKDLKCGLGFPTVSKYISFNKIKVALAEKFNFKCDLNNEFFQLNEWSCSRKLDGVRCLCIKQGDSVKFFSRTGKEYKTLDNLKKIIKHFDGDFVLDGECCCVDEEGKEDFQTIVSQIRKKDYTIENPKYFIFDFLTYDELMTGTGTRTFAERYENLNNYFSNETLIELNKKYNFKKYFEIIQQKNIKSVNVFNTLFEDALNNGWEGLMLRNLNSVYEGKRSNNLLKCKNFEDAEYVVKDVEFGTQRYKVGNVFKEVPVITNVIINHKGYDVSVGSGFSQKQRCYYREHPDKIIGKTITVKYFSESKDKDGNISLRFPTVKFIYDGDRDV